MEIETYQVIVLLLLTLLIVVIILGVNMIEALAALKVATDRLTAKVNSLPTQADHTAEVQAATDAVNSASDALDVKFPAA